MSMKVRMLLLFTTHFYLFSPDSSSSYNLSSTQLCGHIHHDYRRPYSVCLSTRYLSNRLHCYVLRKRNKCTNIFTHYGYEWNLCLRVQSPEILSRDIHLYGECDSAELWVPTRNTDIDRLVDRAYALFYKVSVSTQTVDNISLQC